MMKNLQAEWAFLLLDSLADAGVTEIVISPGSRSTPFVIAAAQNPRLRCYDIIDERTAAFFALGQAKITGRPTVLLCTSGSAAAHYLPAVAEAAAAYIPLLILTADRPYSLQDSGANQTLDQLKFFGQHVRKFCEIGLPQSSMTSLLGLRRMMAQCVMASMFPLPGPVHLNAKAEKPLEPPFQLTPDEEKFAAQVRKLAQGRISKPMLPKWVVKDETLEHLVELFRSTDRGIFVCGPGPLSNIRCRTSLAKLMNLTGFPLAAEAASQYRYTQAFPKELCIDGLDTLLGLPSTWSTFAPELIIQLGAPLTSSGFEHFLRQGPLCKRIVITPYGWNDPHNNADLLIFAEPEELLKQICQALQPRAPSLDFAKGLQILNRKVWSVVEQQLQQTSKVLSEPQAIAMTVKQLPKNSTLVIGNSLPIREVDTYCSQGAAEVDVICQRGLSGIDGLVAGAAGVASVTLKPVTLLLGDVSFLHDISGLALAGHRLAPLVIVVIQNQGGRIFEQLPVAQRFEEGSLSAHFLTPQTYALSAAATLYGYQYQQVCTENALKEALFQAYSKAECTIIEAVVPAHSALDSKKGLEAALEHALFPILKNIANPARAIAARSEKVNSRVLSQGFVMLHGFTGSPGSFDSILAETSRTNVYRPALLGHQPDMFVHQNGFLGEVDRIALSVQKWKEQEGVIDAHLVGYSMGARIALGILVRYPELFCKATLMSVNPGLKDSKEKVARARTDANWVRLLEEKGQQAFVDAWEKQELFTSQNRLPIEIKQGHRKERMQHRPAGLIFAINNIGLSQMPNYWDWLSRIQTSIHLIVGEQDQKFVNIAKEMMISLPHASLTTIPDCGHHPLLEQPILCAQIIFS